MKITYSDITDSNLSAVQGLLIPFYERNWNSDFAARFFRWRFLERTNGEAVVAWDGSNPVGIMDSWLRPYLLDGRVVSVRETCDWFSLPEYRGLGLNLMWKMMDKPEPIVSVGGNVETTQKLLPLLGWKPLPQVTNFIFRLGIAPTLERELLHRSVPGKDVLRNIARKVQVRIRKPKLSPRPSLNAHNVIRKVAEPLPEIFPPTSSYVLSSLPGEKEALWLDSVPASMGEFIWIIFYEGDMPVGFSLNRVFRGDHYVEGAILHIQASRPSASYYNWMIGESSRHLYQCGVQLLRARTSCETLKSAFHTTGFSVLGNLPAHWWSNDTAPPAGNINNTYFRGDDVIRPYPE